jgi:hypothetical protein
MIPYLLAVAGGYLIGNATKDKQLFADGGDVKNADDWTVGYEIFGGRKMYFLYNKKSGVIRGFFNNKSDAEKKLSKYFAKGGGVSDDARLQQLLDGLEVSQIIDNRDIYHPENTKYIAQILSISTSQAYKFMIDLEKRGIASKYGYKTKDGWEDPQDSGLKPNSLYWQISIPSKQGGNDRPLFENGEIVWDENNKRYGVVLNNYDNKDLEVRLDSDGNQAIEDLYKLGSAGDKGTKEQLQEALLAHKRLIETFPDAGYERVAYAEGGGIQ